MKNVSYSIYQALTIAILLLLATRVPSLQASPVLLTNPLLEVKNDTLEIDGLLDGINQQMFTNVDSAYQHYNRLQEILNQVDHDRWDHRFYDVVFDLALNAELGFENRLTLLQQIGDYATQKGDNIVLMHVYRRLSHLFFHTSKLDESLRYQLKALEVSKLPDIPDHSRGFPYVSLAHIYGGREDGTLYADTALTFLDDKASLPARSKHWMHTHIGGYYLRTKQYALASENLLEAWKLVDEIDEAYVEPDLFLALGRLSLRQKEFKDAKEYLERAQVICQDGLGGMPEIQTQISKTMIDLAQMTGEVALAIEHSEKIIEIAPRANFLTPLAKAHRTLYDIYTVREIPELATHHLSEYFELRDALDVRQRANTAYFHARSLELTEEHNQLMMTEANLQLQVNRTITAITFLVFSLVLIVVLFFSRKAQKKHNVLLSEKNDQIRDANEALVSINEQLARAKKKAEESDRLKTSILQNMSHETRTPLTSILGYAEMIAENAENSQEIASYIQRGGRRLMETISSVLDLAQLEGGSATLKPQSLDLCEVVSDAVTSEAAQAKEKGIDLGVSLEESPIHINVDREAIQRVIKQLVKNAVQFTERGEVQVYVRRGSEEVVVQVNDTGPGMDAAFLQLAFEPFRQESTGHGRKHEGVGLGLTITKHLVELMEGRITVTSKKGEGCQFTLRLPMPN